MTTNSSEIPFPPVYYINLDKRSNRRRLQERQARLHGIRLSRVPAIDGRTIHGHSTTNLSAGAVGLWLTFEQLINDLNRDNHETVLILEDDAILVPGFKKRVRKIIARTSRSDVSLVQIGHIGNSAWRRNYSFWRNIKKILRPRSRLRELREREDNATADKWFSPHLGAGTHALLVYPGSFREDLKQIDRTQPLDRAFVLYATQHPGRFVRSRRNLAYQFPFESDIPWTKYRTAETKGAPPILGN